ncbi:MAG: methyltransferase domain-containing protein [Clostridia bacterium]|nr:methyltransferase domain-containing protein [Clostridia bacterium]
MEKEILTLDEAAQLFGVSVKTFIKLLKEDKVPARKIGREWRFSRNALISWLSAGDSQTYSASEGELKEFFNQVAPEWEEISREYYDQSIKNRIVDMGILMKNMTVVDLGCGDGYISRAVSGMVDKVIAIDISSKMLELLNKKAAEAGIKNIETIETEAQEVPLKDSIADVVFASMFLHHIEEPEEIIQEMYRIVRPEGIAVIADFQKHKNAEMKKRMHDVWSGFSTSEVKKWFINAGFSNINIEILEHENNYSSEYNNIGEKPSVFILTAEK